MDIYGKYSTIVDSDLRHYYNTMLLSDGDRRLVHEMFAMDSSLPNKKGDKVKFHRFVVPEPQTATLAEGQNPAPIQISREEVEASVLEKGAYTNLTSKVDLVDVDPILVQYGKTMGKNATWSLDTIARDVYQGGSTVYYGNNVASRGAVITKISNDDLEAIERTMMRNRAEYIETVTGASQNVGTESIEDAYYVIGHTDLKKDLPDLTGYIPRKDYAIPGTAKRHEVGAVGAFRFILSDNATIKADTGGTAVTNSLKYTTASSAADVYPLLIFAKEAVGKVNLKNGGLQMIVNQVGSAAAADPLHRFGTTGWSANTCYVVLNQSWLTRYEVGVSA